MSVVVAVVAVVAAVSNAPKGAYRQRPQAACYFALLAQLTGSWPRALLWFNVELGVAHLTGQNKPSPNG